MESINEVVRNANVILMSCDREGKITLQEGGGLKLHNIIAGEYVGTNVFDTFKYLPEFLDALNIALKGEYVQTVYRWGGDYCETHLTPQSDGGVVAVCTIQTARILREKEHKLEEEIKAREESKRDFLAIISHELRTPLAGLIGIISLMKDNSVETQYFDIMSKTANKLLSLVNDLLDYSKIQKGKIVIECIPYNIYNVIKDTKELFNINAISKNLRLVLEIQSDLKNVESIGDQNRISQILNNFVSNSIKFTEKGTITIGVKNINNSLIYYVKDTGIGIKDTEKENIFKDYTQANEKIFGKFGGTGLGLYISKKLAMTMNGEVGFSSNKNITEFWLQIPFNKNIVEHTNTSTPIIFDNNFHALSTKILVAEDSSTMQFIFQKYLHKLGYTDITLCNNGEIAWDTIYNCSKSVQKSFDFVFLDNYMPKLSGINVANNIITHCKIKPVIVWMSAEDISDELIKSAKFDFCLKKPFDIQEIKKILESKNT